MATLVDIRNGISNAVMSWKDQGAYSAGMRLVDESAADAVLSIHQAFTNHPNDDRTFSISDSNEWFRDAMITFKTAVRTSVLVPSDVFTARIFRIEVLSDNDYQSRIKEFSWREIVALPLIADEWIRHGLHRNIELSMSEKKSGVTEYALGFESSRDEMKHAQGVAANMLKMTQLMISLSDTLGIFCCQRMIDNANAQIQRLIERGRFDSANYLERSRSQNRTMFSLQREPHKMPYILNEMKREAALFDADNYDGALVSEAALSGISGDSEYYELMNDEPNADDLIYRKGTFAYKKFQGISVYPLPAPVKFKQAYADLLAKIYHITLHSFSADRRHIEIGKKYDFEDERAVQLFDVTKTNTWATINPDTQMECSGMFDVNGNVQDITNLPHYLEANPSESQTNAYALRHQNPKTHQWEPIRFYGQTRGIHGYKSRSTDEDNYESQCLSVRNMKDIVNSIYNSTTNCSISTYSSNKCAFEMIETFVRNIDLETLRAGNTNPSELNLWFAQANTAGIGQASAVTYKPFYPPGYASYAGLTFLTTAVSTDTVFASNAYSYYQGELKRALDAFTAFANSLYNIFPDSLVFNRAFASSDSKSSSTQPADMLFEQMFTPHHVPVWKSKEGTGMVASKTSNLFSAYYPAVDTVAGALKAKLVKIRESPSDGQLLALGFIYALASKAKSDAGKAAAAAWLYDQLAPADVLSMLNPNDLDTTLDSIVQKFKTEQWISASATTTQTAVIRTSQDVSNAVQNYVSKKDHAELIAVDKSYERTYHMISLNKIFSIVNASSIQVWTPSSPWDLNTPLAYHDKNKAEESELYKSTFIMGAGFSVMRSVLSSPSTKPDVVFGAEIFNPDNISLRALDIGGLDSKVDDDVIYQLKDKRMLMLYSLLREAGWSRADFGVATVFLTTPVNKSTYMRMTRNNIVSPWEFLLFRTLRERASDMWFFVEKAETLVVAEVDAVSAKDDMGGWGGVRVNVKVGAPILDSSNFARIPAVYGERYMGGLGVEEYQPNNESRGLDHIPQSSGDLCVVPLMRGESSKLNDNLLIVGKEYLRSSNSTVSYSSVAFTMSKYGFGTTKNPLSEAADSTMIATWGDTGISGISSEEGGRYYNHVSEGFHDYRGCKGPLPYDCMTDELFHTLNGRANFASNGFIRGRECTFIS